MTRIKQHVCCLGTFTNFSMKYPVMCKVYTDVQGVHRCARYTLMCKVYTDVQGIHWCARYTLMCKVYSDVQGIH